MTLREAKREEERERPLSSCRGGVGVGSICWGLFTNVNRCLQTLTDGSLLFAIGKKGWK